MAKRTVKVAVDGIEGGIPAVGRKRVVKKAAKKKAKKVGAKKLSAKALADAELARRVADPLYPARALEGCERLMFPAEAMRLGFAVKVMGQPGMKSNDTRRWQQGPHLRVSLGYLAEIFGYLRKNRIHMYRMGSDLAPYATHPTMPQFHGMVRESAGDLAYVGRLAREADVRLSFHPSQFIVLNSENEELTRKSMWDLDSQAEMLDRMECGPEAVLVVHVGGAYGDRASGRDRWCATWPSSGGAGAAAAGAGERRYPVFGGGCARYPRADGGEVRLRLPAPLVLQPGGAANGGDSRAISGDVAERGAAEDALLLRAHRDAGIEAKEPQDRQD